MKKQAIHRILIALFSLNAMLSYSQNSNEDKEKIVKIISSYFELDRENIHLQFDKNIFLTDEKIWFKGYVFNRKTKTPFFTTTNVYATLYDENGTKIAEKLLYGNNGSFSGNFELDDTFSSGKYYVQVYTNWMNNFIENESATFEIDVIDKSNPSLKKNTPDYSKINIEFFPEGGKIIESIKNNIGIKISDCNGKPFPITEGEIINSEGKLIQKFPINRFGYGKFQLPPDNKLYKASFTVNNQKVEEIIPAGEPYGLAIETNNYILKDKTITKIRTNEKSLGKIAEKPLYLIVQQDDKSSIFDINFSNKQLEQTLIFSNENLYEGVNTIRIVDTDMNQLAERFIFTYPKESLNLTLEIPKKANDSVTISGKINFPYNNVSISILPENTISINKETDIFGSLFINPYLNENAIETAYYFNESLKTRFYEMDLLLLNQKTGKYKWTDIVAGPPKKNTEFEIGLTVKGTINQTLNAKNRPKIQLFSAKGGVNEFSEINQKNEFFFDNLVLGDSTWVNFTLKEADKFVPIKLYPQVLNAKGRFLKPFVPKQKSCQPIIEKIENEIPSFSKEVVYLDDVEITGNVKKKMKYKNAAGNMNLRAFKISDTENNTYIDVLQFIQQNGFEVVNSGGQVGVYSKRASSIQSGKGSPAVFIDNVQLMGFDRLVNMRMDEIDEIYLSANAFIPSVRNSAGIIKIYLKTGPSSPAYKKTSYPFVIQQGFADIDDFKAPNYASTTNKGFQNFGTLGWFPTIMSQEDGSFKIQVPKMNQKKIRLLIEGFSVDGKLISEIRTIDLE